MNLSEEGYANCYIVSNEGAYAFTPTRGNSGESVGEISSVEVLWESDGSDVVTTSNTLIRYLKYDGGQITFKTPKSIDTPTRKLFLLKNWHHSGLTKVPLVCMQLSIRRPSA